MVETERDQVELVVGASFGIGRRTARPYRRAPGHHDLARQSSGSTTTPSRLVSASATWSAQSDS